MLDVLHSSLRAKRGNPDSVAASGLPRRRAPRKDQVHFTKRKPALVRNRAREGRLVK